jgi:hypothetical protein
VRQTLAAMRRYNALTYHVHPRYVKERIGKLFGYVGEHLFARWQVRRLRQRVLLKGSGFRVQE